MPQPTNLNLKHRPDAVKAGRRHRRAEDPTALEARIQLTTKLRAKSEALRDERLAHDKTKEELRKSQQKVSDFEIRKALELATASKADSCDRQETPLQVTASREREHASEPSEGATSTETCTENIDSDGRMPKRVRIDATAHDIGHGLARVDDVPSTSLAYGFPLSIPNLETSLLLLNAGAGSYQLLNHPEPANTDLPDSEDPASTVSQDT